MRSFNEGDSLSFYLDYIINTFHSVYKNDHGLTIGYGLQSNADIIISDSGSDFFNNDSPQPDVFIWKDWNGVRIPFLFSDSDTNEILKVNESKAVLNYDIFAGSFFFLSGWQEFHSDVRDEHGRYPFQESFQSKYGIITLPVVNYYFEILKTAIETVSGKTLERVLWKDRTFAVTISHDIDKINSGWLEGGFSELKKGNVFQVLKLLFRKISGKPDSWDNITEIVKLEHELGISSTFFFLTKSGNGNSDYPFSQVTHYFDSIKKYGSETGLHSSLGSCNDPKILLSEQQQFPHSVCGNRFHYLKFEPKTVCSNLEKAGFSYDSSMGFAEHIGFRNGYCFPFKPYDLQKKRCSSFVEIPLMIMDATLSHYSYMGNDPDKFEKVDIVLSEIKKFGGLISILWHNNYFSNHKYSGWKKIFESYIQKIKQQNAVFLTGEEISRSVLNNVK